MFRRQKLEKEEGKVYTDPEVSFHVFTWQELSDMPMLQVSDDMKHLNRRFGWLHGASSLANFSAFLSLLVHGLWLGDADMKDML